jgi:hypothetical protein
MSKYDYADDGYYGSDYGAKGKRQCSSCEGPLTSKEKPNSLTRLGICEICQSEMDSPVA